MKREKSAIWFAVLAAGLYALSSPVSKLLLNRVPATLMAALLYLGAGAGLAIVRLAGKPPAGEKPLTRGDLPYTVGMVLLDIAAPILLMVGLGMTTAANASLLNNFEIVATSVIALCIFHERISPRLWLAIVLVCLSSAILSIEDASSFSFSYGSIFVLLACVCWGLENNCTRMISGADPVQIVIIKGFGSGAGALAISLLAGDQLFSLTYMLGALVLGFVAYGLSIVFYIYAQRYLGAAKTSAYYALAPFIGVGLSIVIFRQLPDTAFFVALAIMGVGTYFASTDTP